MGSMLLDGLLGSTQCVWGFVDGARTHGTELKTMPLLLSSSLSAILGGSGIISIFRWRSGIAGLRKGLGTLGSWRWNSKFERFSYRSAECALPAQ